MRNWFRTQPVVAGDPAPAEAYQEGVIDGERRVGVDSRARSDRLARDIDRRPRTRVRVVRRGSPLLSLLFVVAVAVAGVLIYLAIENGSFSSGGAVVDRSLDKAARRIDAPLKNAAETTGAALQKAGQNLK